MREGTLNFQVLGRGGTLLRPSQRIRPLCYFSRALEWEQHPEDLKICGSRKYGLDPPVKYLKVSNFTPTLCEQPALGWHRLERQRRWLFLSLFFFFNAVASECDNTESPSPGVPFLSINSDKLCPHSLPGTFLRYWAHNCVCLFRE